MKAAAYFPQNIIALPILEAILKFCIHKNLFILKTVSDSNISFGLENVKLKMPKSVCLGNGVTV